MENDWKSRTKIKICGITNEKEAEYLNQNQVDFAGFVLYEKSRRFIPLKRAMQLKERLRPEIKTAAVCVSPDAAFAEAVQEAGFDLLQVHGNWKQEAAEKTKIPVWRAVNVQEGMDMPDILEGISGWVIDGASAGSGKPFDWNRAPLIKKHLKGRDLILAGGLSAENVREGIRMFQPMAVDVSSGVEDAYGKSREKIEAFVRRIREYE